MGACGCRRPSPRTPAATPACPATASRGRPRPPPPSRCSVSLTPAPALPCTLAPGRWVPPAQLAAVPPAPDPAQVTAMPPETPLPVGLRGVIRCPVRANPPLLFVQWTKDGKALQLDKVPAGAEGHCPDVSSFWRRGEVRSVQVGVRGAMQGVAWGEVEGHPCLRRGRGSNGDAARPSVRRGQGQTSATFRGLWWRAWKGGQTLPAEPRALRQETSWPSG